MTRKSDATVYNSVFPSRLKTLLSDSKVSQQELGAILGVQRQTINMYVNGQIRPDIDALAIIAKHFDVTTDWLLGLTNDRERNPIATDELQLSEEAIKKIITYHEKRTYRNGRMNSSLEAIIEHVEFEELLGDLDEAFAWCNEALVAHECGYTEYEGEKEAVEADSVLEGTRWTVITSAKYAEYLVYRAQQLFSEIINDISDVKSVHETMEY